jgi:hypothetical protein
MPSTRRPAAVQLRNKSAESVPFERRIGFSRWTVGPGRVAGVRVIALMHLTDANFSFNSGSSDELTTDDC